MAKEHDNEFILDLWTGINQVKLIIREYCITEGQPWDEKNNLMERKGGGGTSWSFCIKAGRKKSPGVANWFRDKIYGGNAVGCKVQLDSLPNELNFAFMGELSFIYQNKEVLIPDIVIAQGNNGINNNWWFGSALMSNGMVHCGGDYFFSVKPHEVNWFLIRKFEKKQPYADKWMGDNHLIKSKSLRQICIPGSHDAGMSILQENTAFGSSGNTVTQYRSVYGQLMLGTRYFDIRPAIGGHPGRYVTGHYSKVIDTSWQGGNGQDIQAIVNNINTFTTGRKELIILNLSHSLNTNVGNFSYRPFNHEEWKQLSNILGGINYLFDLSKFESDLPKDEEGLYPKTTDIPLKKLIAEESCVMIVKTEKLIDEDKMEFPSFIVPGSRFSIFDEYSDTNNVDKMIADQLKKMEDNCKKQYFLLSWTLTQSNSQATLGVPPITELAKQANNRISEISQKATKEIFPNIICTDAIDESFGTYAEAWKIISKLLG